MIMTHRALSPFILLFTLHGVMSSRAELPRYKLHKKLFDDYNKNVRPVDNANNITTKVQIMFNLNAIVDLDERQQTLKTIGVLYMQWVDKTLQWDPKEFGGVQTVLVNQEDMWVPDINIGNTISHAEQLGYERGPVLLESNGTITWQPHCVFETLCNIDVTYFPFDMQRCTLSLGSRQSVAEEVRLVAMEKGYLLVWNFSPNSQWKLIRTSVWVDDALDYLSTVKLRLFLQRRPIKIVCNIFVPVLFLSVTANLVSLLPIDGGERMGTAVTILLAYAVYLTIIADSLPMNAKKISYLEMYLLFLLGFSTLIAVANVIVVRLDRKKGEVSARFNKYLKRLEPFLCLRCCDPKRKAKLRDVDLTPMNKNETQEPMLFSTSREAVNDGMTWGQAAKIIDRIFFIVFSVSTCLMTLVIFCIFADQDTPENNVLTSDYPAAGA